MTSDFENDKVLCAKHPKRWELNRHSNSSAQDTNGSLESAQIATFVECTGDFYAIYQLNAEAYLTFWWLCSSV